MAGHAANELLSTQKASDSGLQVVLHPLPILEISDFIVRGYQRGFKGAVVGGLLGQHNGREVTIEHSFSCKADKNARGLYELDQGWFKKRLEQMKLVHKSPALDLVGWYSLVPRAGPAVLHLPIHNQISTYNESAILLGFHIEDMLAPAPGDPLPVTIYESNMEAEDRAKEPAGEDKEMKDAEAPADMVLRFRKLPYTTETGEAEMIAMQFIREGGASASVDSTEKHILEQFDKKVAVDDGKGKRRAIAYKDSSKSKKGASSSAAAAPTEPSTTTTPNPDATLTRAEAEFVSVLEAKYNAVKMMKSRLALIITYLQRLPPAFTQGTSPTIATATTTTTTTSSKTASHPTQQQQQQQHTTPSNTILRHIQALVTNAELVAAAGPPSSFSTTTATSHPDHTTAALPLESELQRETNDVHLLSLIADLVASVGEAREVGKKFQVLDSARHARQGGRSGGGGGAGPGFDVAELRGHSGGRGGGGGGGGGGEFDDGEHGVVVGSV